MRTVLVATHADVVRVELDSGSSELGEGLDDLTPTCVATDPARGERAWCGTRRNGVLSTDDGGRSWAPAGLEGRHVMSISASPVTPEVVWAGTEPSAVWRSDDGGRSWTRTAPLADLPSSKHWSFPPRPDTHHVRWIACHPEDERRLWVAVEAGALVTTRDGGATWEDRVESGPFDTHELAVHPRRPELLRVSAGDGYFESHDGGRSWNQPQEGLRVRYLRSVAMDPGDPDVVVVSAASRARSAYEASRADGRLYRREGTGAWSRVTGGWPDPPVTIAPLLRSGHRPGELWAADDRGVHGSDDGGLTWHAVATSMPAVRHLRGFALLRGG